MTEGDVVKETAVFSIGEVVKWAVSLGDDFTEPAPCSAIFLCHPDRIVSLAESFLVSERVCS
jgi:hypothetical protein